MGRGGAAACVEAGGAADSLAGGEVPGKLGGGQSIGAEQPAVVGDGVHRRPAGIKVFLDSERQPLDLRLDLPRQVDLELQAAVIQVASFQPVTRLWT